MTLRMDIQTTAGGPHVDVDLAANAIAATTLEVSYDHPAILKLDAYARQTSYPLGIRNFVRFWVDDYPDDNGVKQTSSNPCFEGFIWDVQPASSNLVKMQCYGSDHMASREIPTMSTTWYDAFTPGVGAVPRLVFNAHNVNDDDFAYTRNNGLTLGNMIATVLADATDPLDFWNAKTVGDTAYVPGELDVFTQVPLEKEVFESQQLGDTLRQLRTYLRDFKYIWNPGTRKWRFLDPSNSPTVTLTLNLSNGNATQTGPNEVLFMDLKRTLDGRYPSVSFIGPPTTVLHQFQSSLGEVDWYGAGTILETYTDALGSHDETGYAMVRIADPEFQRGSRLLPYQVLVSMPTAVWDTSNPGSFQLMITQSPTLEVSYDNGVSWETVLGCGFNFQDGIVYLPCIPYRYYGTPPLAASTQHYFTPTDIKLTWASFDTPLSVRAPTSGYLGTSYTVANMQGTRYWYEERLAVGVNDFNIPITTQHRRDQVQINANHQLQYRKDIAYSGTIVLDGLRFEFMNLNRNIAIAAVDQNGNPRTTGWENEKMIVTFARFDFEERTTTLVVSSDYLKELGVDVGTMRNRLGINNPLYALTDVTLNYDIRVPMREHGGNSRVWYTKETRYWDPHEGRLDKPL